MALACQERKNRWKALLAVPGFLAFKAKSEQAGRLDIPRDAPLGLSSDEAACNTDWLNLPSPCSVGTFSVTLVPLAVAAPAFA